MTVYKPIKAEAEVAAAVRARAAAPARTSAAVETDCRVRTLIGIKAADGKPTDSPDEGSCRTSR